MEADANKQSDAEQAEKPAAPKAKSSDRRRTSERQPAAFTFKDWAQI